MRFIDNCFFLPLAGVAFLVMAVGWGLAGLDGAAGLLGFGIWCLLGGTVYRLLRNRLRKVGAEDR
jgi:hypothetical protein